MDENLKMEAEQKKPKSKIPGFRSGKTWKKVVAIIFYSFVLLAIIGSLFGEDGKNVGQQNVASNQNTAQTEDAAEPTSSSQAETPKPNKQSEKEEIPGTLGFTPDEFKDRFNQAASEFQSDLRITDLKVEEGPVQNTFQYMLTSHLGIIGSVNKQDSSVRSVTILGQGDGTLKSGMNIIASMGILIAAVNPELSPDERGDILKELGIIGDNVDILNLNGDAIRNGKRYFVNSSKEIGIMFGVQDVNDK